jgi:glucosamine--fructose-6-phosphate aminotransferase (isomerizing)
MCGIVGYVGERACTDILIEGLRRLEYRGYDSAGVAVVNHDGACHIRRAAGKLANLENQLRAEPLDGSVGIGHTRWATHGKPSEANAHPHRAGDIVVVHNGIIENHMELRRELEAQGRRFSSETDTEIVSHLVGREKERAPGETLTVHVQRALHHVRGSYAIAVLDANRPGELVAAKNASPLVLGLGQGENFIASDIPAILSHTRQVIFLEEGQGATVSASEVRVWNIATGEAIQATAQNITWSPAMAEKGGFKHFMLKEIHEQPRAITDTIRGRVSLERSRVELETTALTTESLQGITRIVALGCGTAWHAALVGKYLIERLARIPVEVDLASEFRYRDPIIGPQTLVLAVSQSGETADTLAALRLARERGCRILSVCNVVGSSIARESHDVIYTHAGPEIGVASTKAFTTQVTALYLVALQAAQALGTLSDAQLGERLRELIGVPHAMEDLLRDTSIYAELARSYAHVRDVLYLGRGVEFPIALEGALKLKEISYIHAEGYASGEMKHGPIALVDEETPAVFLVPRDRNYEKTLSNLSEVRARNGRVIAVASEGDLEIAGQADHVIRVPALSEEVMPLLTAIPMQLLAYSIADFKGTDVDQPRNLAKSVTVE